MSTAITGSLAIIIGHFAVLAILAVFSKFLEQTPGQQMSILQSRTSIPPRAAQSSPAQTLRPNPVQG